MLKKNEYKYIMKDKSGIGNLGCIKIWKLLIIATTKPGKKQHM